MKTHIETPRHPYVVGWTDRMNYEPRKSGEVPDSEADHSYNNGWNDADAKMRSMEAHGLRPPTGGAK